MGGVHDEASLGHVATSRRRWQSGCCGRTQTRAYSNRERGASRMNKDTPRTPESQDPPEHFAQPLQTEHSIFGCKEATLHYPRRGGKAQNSLDPADTWIRKTAYSSQPQPQQDESGTRAKWRWTRVSSREYVSMWGRGQACIATVDCGKGIRPKGRTKPRRLETVARIGVAVPKEDRKGHIARRSILMHSRCNTQKAL